MKKKVCMTLTTAALAFTLTAPAVFGAPDSQGMNGVTRGQFFKQITDHLKLVPTDASTALPKDVSADSSYADAVRILTERGIIDGYPDGTFRTEQPITAQEAGFVLGRFLGISDTQAAAELKSGFGVSLGQEDSVNPSLAAQVIQSALASDASAQALMEKSQEAHAKLTSFSAHMIQEMQFKMRAGGDNAPLSEEAMKMAMESEVAYNKDTGMHIVTSMVSPIPGTETKMEMEQYIVPDGFFMKMNDPVSNQPKWVNMSKQMPYQFNDLMAIQKSSMELNKAFINKNFFYRDLGSENHDGKMLRKIAVYGKISSFDDIIKMMGSAVKDQNMLNQMAEAPGLKDMSISMTGTMFIDEETHLAEQMNMNMSLHYPEAAGIPIEQMDMNMKMEYKEFNAVPSITLPDEVKQAPELTIPSVPPTQDQGDTKTDNAETVPPAE